jgi:hypothetical protein
LTAVIASYDAASMLSGFWRFDPALRAFAYALTIDLLLKLEFRIARAHMRVDSDTIGGRGGSVTARESAYDV